jgi:hypothetical protein
VEAGVALIDLVLLLSAKLFCPVLQHYFSSTFQRTNNVFLSQQISISQISAKPKGEKKDM